MIRKMLAAFAAIVVGSLTFGGTAHATPSASPALVCKTTVTNLNRPDHGHGTVNGGFWANLSVKRTTKVCELPPEPAKAELVVSPPATAHYKATVTDEGTLTTIAGTALSPNNGVALVGGVKGKVKGGYTQDFYAATGFLNWQGNFNAQTYSGTGNPATTGDWVEKVYGGDDFKSRGLNDDWSWFYWLCTDRFVKGNEYWWDAAAKASDDGTTVAAGDIVGKQVCPSPSASPTPSPSVTVGVPPVNSPSLPVTGSRAGIAAGVGLVVILVGAALVAVSRRRRPRPEFVTE